MRVSNSGAGVGTAASLQPGDVLRPGVRRARETPEEESRKHVFTTARPDNAQFYADTAYRTADESPRVYQVESVGEVRRGRLHDWQLGGEYVSDAFRVLAEEVHPYEWPDEANLPPVVDVGRLALRLAGTRAEADQPRSRLPTDYQIDHEAETT
jgi:Rifampin ADP-ribosyl transferase